MRREGKRWQMLLGDSVERAKELRTHSIGFSIQSPPFPELYCYSDDPRDMGNCKSVEEFIQHFEYLIPEALRVLMPGRLFALHCMDLPLMKGKDGVIALRDFPSDLRSACERHGFLFHSRVVIWKDPLIAATRTKALGLLHKQLVKDSAICRQGIADQLIVMRTPGENPEAISHLPSGLTHYIGDDEPTAAKQEDPAENKYSHEVWQRYASPVWMDIDLTDTLKYRGAKAEQDEKHICPLQLPVVQRAVDLWSNPGDTIASFFAGIGSEGVPTIAMGRSFWGCELKRSYFNQACRHLADAEAQEQLDLEEVAS